MNRAPAVELDPDAHATGRQRPFGAAAARTALVVGTALTLINHPEVLRLGLAPDLVVPTALNYVVPFLVSGYSRYRLLRDRSLPAAQKNPAIGGR